MDCREAAGKRCDAFRSVDNVCRKSCPKAMLSSVSEPDYFSEQLDQNWTGNSEKNVGDGIHIGDAQSVVPLDLFTRLGVVIHKQSFTSECTGLVHPVKALLKSGV